MGYSVSLSWLGILVIFVLKVKLGVESVDPTLFDEQADHNLTLEDPAKVDGLVGIHMTGPLVV